MLPRSKRLTRTGINTLLRASKRHSSEHFSVQAPIQKNGLFTSENGYAIVVSKKTARLSVTRHRIKRRVAAMLQELSPQTPLIIYPKGSVGRGDFYALKQELHSLLSKVIVGKNL